MKKKITLFWDKYFFHVFSVFVILLIISGLWLFIGKPPVACTELLEESKEGADAIDREKRCFNIWQMDELKAHNEYLADKYPPPKAEDNYFIDRLNPNSSINWLNE